MGKVTTFWGKFAKKIDNTMIKILFASSKSLKATENSDDFFSVIKLMTLEEMLDNPDTLDLVTPTTIWSGNNFCSKQKSFYSNFTDRASIMPDCQSVCFALNRADNKKGLSIFKVNSPLGSDNSRGPFLFEDDFNNINPCASPDGRYIVFLSDRIKLHPANYTENDINYTDEYYKEGFIKENISRNKSISQTYQLTLYDTRTKKIEVLTNDTKIRDNLFWKDGSSFYYSESSGTTLLFDLSTKGIKYIPNFKMNKKQPSPDGKKWAGVSKYGENIWIHRNDLKESYQITFFNEHKNHIIDLFWLDNLRLGIIVYSQDFDSGTDNNSGKNNNMGRGKVLFRSINYDGTDLKTLLILNQAFCILDVKQE